MSTARSQPWAGLAIRPHRDGILTVIAATALLIAAVVAGQTSAVGLVVIGAALAGVLAIASLRWPQVVIVLVILTPILDRYIVAEWLPDAVARLSHLLSEAMLLTVGAALGVQAWRRGQLLAAVRHPVTIGLAAFVLLAVASALLNAVPPQVAAVGLAFTLDASACFYLPRLAGFSFGQSLRAVGAFLVLVGIAAIGGLLQWILRPDFLGLEAWRGVYGEGYRLASIFTDPNTFGALLIGAIPFAAFGVTSLQRPGNRLISLFALVLLFIPMYLTFSRGAWAGLLLGGGVALAIISWRTLVIAVGVGIISFMIAVTLPRMVLGSGTAAPSGPSEPAPSYVGSTWSRIGEIWAGKDLRTRFIVNAVPIVADHPLLGVGPGRYGGAAADVFGSPVYPEYGTDELFKDPEQLTVDNFWLHLLVESGVLGVAAYVAAALAALIPIVRVARRTSGWSRFMLGGIAGGSLAMALDAVTTMLLEANSVAFVVWLMLGLGSLVVAAATASGERAAQEPAPAT